MEVAAINWHTPPAAPRADFIHGKDYVHENGNAVNFNDTSWCICPLRGKQVTIYFEDLPRWLTRPAKLTVAHGWLMEGKSTSWLLTRMSGFRRVAEWLGDFEGASIAELTYEHKVILQARLADELTRYNETLEAASIRLGRPLSFRESKQLCMELRMLGSKGVSTVIATFNYAARLLDEIDDLAVTIRLQNPRIINHMGVGRGIGSADPSKVLTPQQIAELERALGKARALIDRVFGDLDLTTIERRRRNPVFDLEHYFGLNGLREHTASEIATLRGLSPSGDMNIPRLIKGFLSKRIGADLADEVITLRSQFGALRAQKRFEELSAARQYIFSVLAKADLSFLDRKPFCIEQYFGLHGYRVRSLSAIAKQLGLKSERPVLYHVHEGLFSLVGERKGKRLLGVRDRLLYYLTRAIKAQVLRLQLSVARRISAVLGIPAVPKMRVRMIGARRVVEVLFRAGKTWGDEGMDEWVPCVDKFGEIAEDAIRATQTLTKDLRQIAPEEIRGLLFIIPDRSVESVVPLSSKVIQEYIYTNQKGKDLGVLRRYALEGLLNFEFHHIRQTHSTHMIEEGGTIQDVAHYLGHTTANGTTTMAGVFYLAGSTEVMRQQTAEALRRGAATGLQFDGVARMKIESMGEEAKKAPVPPNQLSFEQARQRVLSGDIIDDVPVSASEAVRLLNQKIVFNVTRWGGCLLQATGGHCPTANPCPIGIVPNSEEPKLGCGCKYLVVLPHSADQLSADVEKMEAQLAEMTEEKWTGWRAHTIAKRNHWRALLEIAMSLDKPVQES